MSLIKFECALKIIEQMKKNVCKIKVDQIQGTGFFCKIPFPDYNNMLHVLITTHHIIDEKLLYEENGKIVISIKADSNIKELNLNNRIKYTNKIYDITLIELKAEDNISDFLELDDNILDDIFSGKNKNEIFIDENMYILEYVMDDLNYSTGILQNINESGKYLFAHKCCTGLGSGGSPILNIKTNKVIGIHHSAVKSEKYGLGTFLNYPLKEFINIFKSRK